MRKFITAFIGSLALLPTLALAHEVYVLDTATIAASIATTSPNPFLAYIGNESRFYFWAFIALVTVSTILCATIFRLFESSLDPVFDTLKSLALTIARITAGLCFVFYGVAGALYGSELPLIDLFGGFSSFVEIIFLVLGVVFLAGIYTRIAALVAILIYVYSAALTGWYALTYLDHLGLALLLLILGSGSWSVDHLLLRNSLPKLRAYVRPYAPLAFALMRIPFGAGIIYAAFFAKYMHSQLALEVVLRYDLTSVFPFDPLFIVMGALIVEMLAGLMLVLGLAVRWTSLFLLIWLILGQLYFQEYLWVHLVLFGGGLTIFAHGYDRYSLEGLYMRRNGLEPAL